MYKAFKYKLTPNKEQEQQLVKWVGASRWIWNWCLDTNKNEYEKTKKFIFRYDLKLQIPNLKKEHEWLTQIPSQALQNRILDFDSALKRIWKQGNGFPKYKLKHIEHHNTFRIDQTNKHIKPTKAQIQIPKMGWVKWKRHRPLEGKLKNITIKQENGHWWCICLCDIGDMPQLKEAFVDQLVGIDLGLKNFAITSDGEVFETPKLYRKRQKKIKRKQQILSRRNKGSKNREKARKALNKEHYNIKCQRQDFTHKASTVITKQYTFIAVEDLNIAGMQKNKHLAKAISDQAWAMFVEQLSYKSKINGGNIVKIGRFKPSSKTCSSCGNIQPMPLYIRTYECLCGLTLDRDINAAINIKNWGRDEINRAGTARIYACGDTTDEEKAIDFSSHVSMKQEKFLTSGKEAVSL